MADGSVKIDVGLNIGKAEKDLAKLRDKINKAEDALNANAGRKTELEKQIAEVGAQADEAKKKVIELKDQLSQTRSRDEKASIRAQLADATEEQRILTRESNSLNDEFVRVNDRIGQGTQNLEDMREEAGELVRQIERARPGEAIANSLESAKRSLAKFLKYAIGIRSVYILFQRLKQSIKSAVQEYAEYDRELKYNLALMSATKKAIQITNGAALASIYSAILPVVQKIANWMLEAANAASRFIAILSGKSSYKRAVVSAEEVAASLEEAEDDTEDTADAADDVADGFKEAKKQVLGFDELNILDSDKDEKTTKDPKEKIKDAEKAALDGIDIIEESIDGLDESFLDKLALTMKDVLFDWHDLNPEQIAEKFIAGLGALLGAALGIALGMGPGGVLLMTLGGLMLGLVADSLIFDHDGKLDKEEILSMVLMALGGLAGGVLGFKAGGFKGAMIGVWIGAGLGLLISQLLFDRDGRLSRTEILDSLLTVINGIVGGVLGGFTVGGTKGAMIGATIGVGATLLFKFFDMKTEGKFTNLKSGIVTMINSVLTGYAGLKVGAAVGGTVGGPIGAIIGIVVGIGLTMLVESIRVSMAARDAFYDTDFGKTVQELKDKIQDTLQADTDIRVHINSITGEIDDNTLANLGAAQALIEKIFTLDAKENKTTEEAALLKTQVEALNNLGLPGIQLAFDETTGHVQATRQEIQGMLDDLMKQYQIEAMKDAYIESFKAQYESTENVKKATGEAQQAVSDYQTAVQNLSTAQETLNTALEEYNTNAGYGYTSERLTEAKNAVKAAEEGVEATKKNAENAKATLETAMNTADLAAEKVNNIGEALAGLVTEGTESGKNAAEGFSTGISENAALGAEEANKMGTAAIDALAEALDAHSPSKKTEEQGQNAVDGFKNAIERGTPTVVQAAHSMMEQLIHEYTEGVQRLKQVMNFTWSIPRPKIPKINWTIKNVSYGNGQSVSIPEFFVNWYARGGVFDFPQLIGVGEAGKEAVVPLERNTEWMDMVADGLMERFERANFANDLADAFTKLPKPAMAGGSIVPPNAVGGGGISREDMQIAIERGVYNAIMALGGMPKSRGGMTLDVNGREFARAIYSDMQAVGNEHGISLIES